MEKNIIEYHVVTAMGPDGLTTKLNQELIKGYQPLGGVSVIQVQPGGQILCSQAVVRYE